MSATNHVAIELEAGQVQKHGSGIGQLRRFGSVFVVIWFDCDAVSPGETSGVTQVTVGFDGPEDSAAVLGDDLDGGSDIESARSESAARFCVDDFLVFADFDSFDGLEAGMVHVGDEQQWGKVGVAVDGGNDVSPAIAPVVDLVVGEEFDNFSGDAVFVERDAGLEAQSLEDFK